MEHDPPEVIPNLPAARVQRAPELADEAARLRGERVKILGEDLYELCQRADTRTEDERHHLLPLSALAAAWLARKKSDRTKTVYRSDIRRYITWCAEVGINPAVAQWFDFEMYALHLNDVGTEQDGPGRGVERLSSASRLRYLTAVSSFYRFAAARNQIVPNPTESLEREQLEELSRRVLTIREQTTLWEAAQSYPWPKWNRPDDLRRVTMKACIAIGLDHGWRVAQYSTTKVADLRLIVDDLGEYPGFRTRLKGGKIKEDGFTDRARDAVSEMLAFRGLDPADVWRQHQAGREVLPGPLITFKHNTAPTQETLRVHLIELCVYAGIDPGSDNNRRTDRITWHCLRRTSGTGDLDAGATHEAVADKLGHSNTETTRRYYDQHRFKINRSPAMTRGLITPWNPEDQ